MTRFENGPAHGVTLMLHRSPYFLRVTYDGKDYDGLDQLEDTPRPEETIYVYRIAEIPSWCHIRATKGGGMYAFAKYEYVSPQPPAEVTRDNDSWQKWTAEQTEDTKRYEAMLAELEARK